METKGRPKVVSLEEVLMHACSGMWQAHLEIKGGKQEETGVVVVVEGDRSDRWMQRTETPRGPHFSTSCFCRFSERAAKDNPIL